MTPEARSAAAVAGTPATRQPGTAREPHRSGRATSHVLLDLLLVLTWRDIKIKYKQSVMGLFWAVLMPTIIVGAGMLVRVAMSKMSGVPLVANDLASMSVKSLPWAFFLSGIRFSTNSLTGNTNLVTKINCPRIAFPAAAVLSSLFDLVVATLPLIATLAWCGVKPTVTMLWAPLLIALLVLLVSGLGAALAAANLFYRDVKYLVEVILTFAIFFTPVIYEAKSLGDARFWIMLNPISPLLEGLRSSIVLGQSPDLPWLAYSAVFSCVVFLGGWGLFQRLEPTFADRI